jgi:H+-transporting ATPase
MNPRFTLKDKWFPRSLAYVLRKFYDQFKAGKRPVLLLQTPPQHGKSLTVIDFIVWCIGHDPRGLDRDGGVIAGHHLDPHTFFIRHVVADRTSAICRAATRYAPRRLGMGTHIIPAADAFPKDMDPNNVPSAIADAIERADGFARVFPEHKYAIVKALQARGHLVAMTGDGVNDAPALKQADCGTAVSGATDAARGAAALILTAPGLSVIDKAIDEARRIGRITSYTIYRVALTMDIMFLVVLSSIFLNLVPLTAVMIVVMSLLDDVPIMTIAYDNTPVSEKPIRWQMPSLLGVSLVLGLFSIVESFGLLLIGIRVLSHPYLQEYFGLTTKDQLQTVMFLQLVTGGHLLVFVTRTQRWFFLPPFPAAPLFAALLLTQVVAWLMCGFGWLVPSISWSLIGWVLVYNIAWMFVLGGARLITERFTGYRTARQARSAHLVNQSLQPHMAS